jgi:hypothetical protein
MQRNVICENDHWARFPLSLERCGLCLNVGVGDVWRSFSSTSPNEPNAVTGLTMSGGSWKSETEATESLSACAKSCSAYNIQDQNQQ